MDCIKELTRTVLRVEVDTFKELMWITLKLKLHGTEMRWSDLSVLGYGQVAGCYEYGNVPSGAVKYREFQEKLRIF
jgi:hypothetical protein